MSKLESNIDVGFDPGDLTRINKYGTARPTIVLPSNGHDPGVLTDTKPEKGEPYKVSPEKLASVIFDVGNRLPNSRLKDVKFLCYGKTSDNQVLENAKKSLDIFLDMQTFGTLDRDNLGLMAELLHRIGMIKAKREVFEGTGITWSADEGRSYLDPFRCLLHSVGQQLVRQKLHKLIEYCWFREIRIDEDTDNFFDFFTSLEEREEIAADNIGLLKDFSDKILKNKRVKDYLDDYEKEMMKQGPILSMTEEKSEKLLKLSLDGKLFNKDICDFYKNIFKGATMDNQMETDTEGTSKLSLGQSQLVTALKSKSLITPSMLKQASSSMSPRIEGEKLSEKSQPSVPSSRDGRSSPEPMDDSPSDGQLQSKDIQPDAVSSYDDEDPTEYFTLLDDYRETLKFPCYRMDSNPKGICLIISIEHFDRKPETEEPTDRDGSEKDVENLTKTFVDLNFKVHTRRDFTAGEIKKELKSWGHYDHSRYNAFICCLLSHGNKGIILGKDGKAVELSKIIGYFKGQNCQSLINKPKIFIVQACQGDNWQSVTTENFPHSPTEAAPSGMGSGLETLPKEVDILLILSTIPGYKSARSRVGGSWFIMALTHIMKKHPDAEMQSVVTLLNLELSRATKVKQEGRTIAQTALPSHTLRKLLFLKEASHIQQSGNQGGE